MMTTSEKKECHSDLHYISSRVIFNRLLPGQHGLMRLAVGELAGLIQPGQFVHLTCDTTLTLPRPFSCMNADAKQGTIDLFYRILGRGTDIMTHWQTGQSVFLLMPIGHSFLLPDPSMPVLLIAGGAGLAPVYFLAHRLKQQSIKTTLLWGIETACPLETIAINAEMDATLALADLHAIGITSHLASMTPYSGRFQGFVTDLAACLLNEMEESIRIKTQLIACGPLPMLKAVNQLAVRFGLQGQVSLEERMACGFGGCAACVVPIQSQNNLWSYQKICTDGPVFSLMDVAWEHLSNSH